jgi:hypothetical protein
MYPLSQYTFDCKVLSKLLIYIICKTAGISIATVLCTYGKLCVVNSDSLGTVADVMKSMFVGTGFTFKIFSQTNGA